MKKLNFNSVCIILAITASTIVAVIGLFLMPFWVEDATVLFHRSNYLEFSFPIYYAGYASILPQFVAYIVVPLPPFLQAVAYSFVALIIWSFMLTLYFKIAPISFIPFAVLAYFFVFDWLYLFNLTYSQWPSVVIIGLIAILSRMERRAINWWESLIILTLSMSSPLSFFMAIPLSIAVFQYRKSTSSWVAFLACIASYPILTEPGAGAALDILASIADRLKAIIEMPSLVFSISGERLPISPAKMLRAGALIVSSSFVFLCLIPSFRRQYGVLLPFACACVAIFFVSLTRASTSEAIGTRYYFPVIFSAMLIVSFILADFAPWQFPSIVRITFYCVTLSIGIAACLLERPDIGKSLGQFQTLFSFRWAQVDSRPPEFIDRAGSFNENDWTLALGNFSFTHEDCKKYSEDTYFRFQVHCGSFGSIRYSNQ